MYDTLRLEKGMYHIAGKTFSQVLEELDPSLNYAGSELAKLDAFQRQLKRFDIRVNGAHSDRLEKFFATSDSAALFPEYVSRAVAQGMQEVNVLGDIVAATTKIDAMDYRSIVSVPTEDDKTLKDVEEGAAIPSTSVKVQENLVQLHKRGRMLEASYEAIRFQRIDLFTVTLRQIGSYIAKMLLKDAINVIQNGDGNENPATVDTVETAGKLAYNDLLALWARFGDYDLNTLIASPAMMQQLLLLPQFQDSNAGLTFHATGKTITPLGANLIKTTAAPADLILALDKNYALEMVIAADVMMESDKLIDRQLERTTISTIAGFAKIFQDASRVLNMATA